MTATHIRWDPYDYAIDADPHPTWRRMRDEAPVYRNDEYGFYALSRFADVLAAHLDHETLISGRGTVLEMMDHPMDDPPMLFMDPPRHTRMRKLVSRAFTPRRIGQLEERIRDLCAGYLDPFVGAGGFDYARDFSMKLPVMVISSLLGVPEEDQEQLRVWTDQQLHRDPGEVMPGPVAQEASRSIYEYWQGLIDERRRRPRDDIMTELMQADLETDVEGETRPLTDRELHAFYGLLSAAGNETVARHLGWACLLLEQFPEERAKLVERPGLVPDAVEEILRYEAPSPVQARWVSRDRELHGETIPAGSKLILLTGSADRDDREFPDPDRLDVERRPRHVAFGYGIHFCLGAALARMESKVALTETLARFPRWEVDRDAVEMVHTSTVRGPASVPITY